ncbi:TraB/GumN family protein [Stenotrophomonas sp. Marseille-Q4652]|uniref:TraB/GumN family protein n=1 Tax=Stenotrophomonas sp. Marseille-Q4652 TaxID=2866595 RepID=UPI001CE3E9A3|nr:TraB/GumN family protein [Stenotrophomonas sp. Marseille-Q4652]
MVVGLCWAGPAQLALAARSEAVATIAPPVPLLWKVSNKDGTALYLLGSFHMLKADDYPLSSDVDAALDASARVLFELSPEEMNSPALARSMLQAAMYTGGRQLKDDLAPATWQQLQSYAQANQLPLASLAMTKPWFVALSISMAEMARQGMDAQAGLDRHLMARASEAGKRTGGLETAATQIAMLDGMAPVEQQQLLSEALQQAGDGELSRRLHEAWRRGDDRMLWEEMAQQMRRDYPQLYQRINVDRNDAWLPALEQRLQAGQGNTLVVVGALHLLGSDGVVEKLRARGYAVERICSACARKGRRP